MDDKQIVTKKPISKDMIFKIMLYLAFGVSGLFLLKNVIGGNWTAVIIIGACLAVFSAGIILMKTMRTRIEVQQFTVSMALLVLVFIISMNSGKSYSDDFSLYLAILGLTGLYLRPKYTLIQTAIADIFLVIQCLAHPEKVGEIGQFILCVLMFNLAAVMFHLTIRRGRAFIEISQARAEEAERLLDSINRMGAKLKENFEHSSVRIEQMQEANSQMECNARELKDGSVEITRGAREVADTCVEVQNRIQVMEGQIGDLNEEVRTFEKALSVNRNNMDAMNRQMESVKNTMYETNKVFERMDCQMKEIFQVTEQLNSISANTTMLALNASIEAARAGQMGAGFAVVASKVQELAVDSNKCSGQVDLVVGQMQAQIQNTTDQLSDSEDAIRSSLDALTELQDGFQHLTSQFSSLYQNIEEQNSRISDVDEIFGELKGKILQMSDCSEENQSAVGAIAEALGVYKDNVKLVITDTRQIQELSASMLDISKDTENKI